MEYQKDKRVDTYIKNSAAFARPILEQLRTLVHNATPGISETIKWGMPAFEYKGPLCNMAAFKEHCVFGFWKAALMKDAHQFKANQQQAMGHAGKIRSVKDLPSPKVFSGWIKEAIRLNEEGIKLPARTKAADKPVIEPPVEFSNALAKNKKASKFFQAFSPSHKRAYLEWILEAKTTPTREKRINTSIEWIAEGKGRNWKYEQKVK